VNQQAVFFTACRPSATVADGRYFQADVRSVFEDTSEIL